MWIKAVSPLVDILKITPGRLNDKQDCTKHLGENENGNLRQTATLQGSCSHFDLSSELLLAGTSQDICSPYRTNLNNNLNTVRIHEKDTFRCGRCKAQFEVLSEFINHKRTQCDIINMTDKTESASILLPDFVPSKQDRLIENNITLHSISGSEELIELTDEETPSRVFSLVVGNNQFFITNPLELTDQLMMAPTTKPEVILTTENGLPMASSSKEMADGVLNNSSLGELNVQDDIILELQYKHPAKTDRIKTKLPCSYCGKLFEKPFNLQQHERVHTGERPFQCVICGRAFTQKANVRKHMMRHKVWPQAKQTLKINRDKNSGNDQDRTSYSCQYCSLSFSSYSLHKKHLTVHSDFKVYRCIQKGCDETFGDLDEFLCHSESHSSAEFQCHVCLNVFTSLEELGAHQYDHDLPKKIRRNFNIKLKCEICNAQFKSAESLKNHMAVDPHNYECPHCDSVFSCERFLRRHLATHPDPSQSRFECELCKKTFRTQKYLINHSFIHSEEKPFDCELCGKQFASKYRLKRHLAIHLSQYLECPFKSYLGCEKKFYRKDKLRNHVTTHCRFKARNCQVCGKAFPSFAKLQQHSKREHKVTRKKQILKCVGCSQTFRKQKQLTQHHCTVGEKKFRSRIRSEKKEEIDKPETVSNIEIIMVPYMSNFITNA